MKDMKTLLEAVGLEPDWQDKTSYHSRRRRVEVNLRWRGPCLHLSAYGDNHLTLVIGLIALTVYVKVPRWINLEPMEGGIGFTFFDRTFHLMTGGKTRVFSLPWDWSFHKRWEWVDGYMNDGSDGQWFEIPSRGRYNAVASKREYEFTYTLKSGEVQKRKATASRDRMEWRWHWLKWLPWPRKVRTSIWVEFDDEVGERTGSWKGGTMGCGYDMKPGESPLETLRRMERERKFN